MSTAEARNLLTGHDNDARHLSGLKKTALASIAANERLQRGMTRVMGGLATKDELVGEILDFRYPHAERNEAIHVLYHNPGEIWPACGSCGELQAPEGEQ